MTNPLNDAIQAANAHLNDVALPNYSMLMDTLRYLLAQAKLSDIGERNAAVLRADEMVEQYTKRFAEQSQRKWDVLGGLHMPY